MDNNLDLHDWELLHGSDLTENYACVAVLDEDPSNFTLMDDYFALGSGISRKIQSEESDEGGIDSDNPSCPDSDCNSVLESSKEDLGFSGMERDSGEFLSDESSDGKGLEVSVVELGFDESFRSDLKEMREIRVDEKREKMWWNVPIGLIKFFLCGIRPVWSLSLVSALVGFVLLWRKVYRMKKKSRIIPLKLDIDEKKTSQFAARSARLNAVFSVVRRMPSIRPSLQEGVATQWAALPLR